MIQIKKPQMMFVRDKEHDAETYGKFVIEPLERGFGITLGNSLRRVLLSALPGAAVTAVRLDGILHEFTTIKGVMEDVTDILLNVKQIVVKLEGEEPVTIRAEKKGPGTLTAGDFVLPNGLTVVNPDQVVATLGKDAKIAMELDIEKGRGYRSSEQNAKADRPFNTIVIDSSFSPIRRVNYAVEDTRVGQEINYDRLILELWTNGAMLPDEATSLASQFLMQHLGLFVEYIKEEKQKIQMISEEKEKINKNLDIPIKDIEFSVRSRNCLKRTDIKTIGDLAAKTAAELLQIKNFGMKSLNEVKEKLTQYNLGLREEKPAAEEKE